jgi:hypothetical protein
MKSNVWKERKDALEAITIELNKHPRLDASANYAQLIDVIKVC